MAVSALWVRSVLWGRTPLSQIRIVISAVSLRRNTIMHNARSKDVEYSHLTVTQPNRMQRTIQIKLVNRNEKFLKDYDGIPVPTVYLFIHFKNRERDFIISKWRP